MAQGPNKRRNNLQPLWTVHKKASFLKAFKKLGGVYTACNAVSINPSTVQTWRERDPAFAAEYLAAKEADTEELEKRARFRAMKRSDILMMFLLNGRRPEMYRQNAKVTHAGGITVRDLLVDDDPPAKGAK